MTPNRIVIFTMDECYCLCIAYIWEGNYNDHGLPGLYFSLCFFYLVFLRVNVNFG